MCFSLHYRYTADDNGYRADVSYLDQTSKNDAPYRNSYHVTDPNNYASYVSSSAVVRPNAPILSTIAPQAINIDASQTTTFGDIIVRHQTNDENSQHQTARVVIGDGNTFIVSSKSTHIGNEYVDAPVANAAVQVPETIHRIYYETDRRNY